ncbi:MAG TPA: ribosome biogenesis GTP-binding protein YihA/YsxC [Candidatus Paceibacterota bacterium]|nr:ribosome biogenesis GTP-binding protein YihA/YsxC [Candidatus Paceibacterota bacterium]
MKIKKAEFSRGIMGTNEILYDGVPQYAFVGRSNVGKSSLINSLLNRTDLVKVSQKPGKTTEINFFSINNRQCYFVDLPGYGYAEASPEQRAKIEKLILWYFMYSEAKPRLVVVVLDMKAGLTEFDTEMIRMLRKYGHPLIVVANKADKLNRKDTANQLKKISESLDGFDAYPYSAVSRKGAEALLGHLFEY